MLPPGIFLWKTGFSEIASPFDIDAVASSHPLWSGDLAECGPWSGVHLDEVGDFVRGSGVSEVPVVVVGRCGSTMEVARFLGERGILGEWGVVVGVEQCSGRGQLRRHWVSPPGNLHMSILLPTTPASGVWSESLSDLWPLIAAFLVSSGLEELGADLRIKWPNDLLQENRKVGGMLIEEKAGVVVLGVGLNLADCPPDELMREDHSVSAGVLQTNRRNLGPLELAALLVNRGKNMYVSLLDEKTPSRFVTALEDRLAWFGLMVEVREGGGESYQARIIGLSPQGGLVIQRGGRENVLFSGSIFPL